MTKTKKDRGGRKKSFDTLPTFDEVIIKKDRDPIEHFIYEYEPAGKGDKKFREDFQEALYYFITGKGGKP